MPHHPDRLLPLQGASNFRDLGGYRSADGRSVRWRRLFRSDHLAGLSAQDVAQLQALGLSRSFDLRGQRERAAQAYALPGVRVQPLPIEPTVVQGQQAQRERGEALTADAALLGMLAPDGRIQQRWAEIDELEKEVTAIPRLSLRLAQGLLDGLASARNRLLNNRDQIEDAEREMAEVRYRLQRIRRSKWFEQPSVVFGVIVVMLLVIVFGALAPLLFSAAFDALSAQVARLYPPEESGVRLADLWNTIIWGGLGGVTGALYGLWIHVADKKDFDVEYSMWYYANPLMGLMLGAFIYVLVMSGVLTFLQAAPMVMYILAWVVGFQQNVAFKLVNNVLKRLAPADDKA